MVLKNSVQNVLVQLTGSLKELSDTEYAQPCKALFNASIGQHVRHIIELFLCLEKGYETGVVNYERRSRDHRIETEKNLAIRTIQEIYQRVDRPNIALRMNAEDYDENLGQIEIPTNYYREIAYNLEHTIHHMALIRVGINDVSSVKVSPEFGVAYSTIKYWQECAQ